MPEMMKVGAIYGKEDLRIEQRPVPKAGPGQMVVKIDYCGICGTDVEFYKSGKVPAPLPMVLGHENIGTVYELGEGVTGFEVGERILCGPPSACEELCPPCLHGDTNICINGFKRTAGIGGPDGGFAEYMLIRNVAHTMLIKVPAEVDPKDAVLFDVICVALHGIRKSNFKVGDNVVVSGTGPIGLSAIQFLKAGGANKLIVLGTSDGKESILRQYGADYFINVKKCDDLDGEIKRILGSPVGVDIAYECAGSVESLQNCMYKCIKPGGQIMGIGTPHGELPFLPGRVATREPDLKFTFVYTAEEVQMYLEMLAAGKISFPGMVTGVVSLDECVEKFIGNPNRQGQIKVLIDPNL